jgi:hypothetical protein
MLKSPLPARKVIVNEESAHDTELFITKRLTALKNQRSSGDLEDLALVIGSHPCHLHVVRLSFVPA